LINKNQPIGVTMTLKKNATKLQSALSNGLFLPSQAISFKFISNFLPSVLEADF